MTRHERVVVLHGATENDADDDGRWLAVTAVDGPRRGDLPEVVIYTTSAAAHIRTALTVGQAREMVDGLTAAIAWVQARESE